MILTRNINKQWKAQFTEYREILRDNKGVAIRRGTEHAVPLPLPRYEQPWDRRKLTPRRLLEGEGKGETLRIAMEHVIGPIVQPEGAEDDQCFAFLLHFDENFENIFENFNSENTHSPSVANNTVQNIKQILPENIRQGRRSDSRLMSADLDLETHTGRPIKIMGDRNLAGGGDFQFR